MTKNVTLLGAQYGVPATVGRMDLSRETIINAPAGNDVTYSGAATTGTVEGFSLLGNGKASGDNDGLLAVANAGTGYTFTDDIITGTTTGINFHATGATPTAISGNRITANTEAGSSQGSNGIFFTNGPSNGVSITSNTFGAQGVDINTTGSGTSTTVSNGLVVSNNTSQDSANFLVLFLTTGASITHNTIRWDAVNSTSAATAIAIYGGDTGTTVSDNTIAGGSATSIRVDNGYYTPNSAITITGNTLSNRLNGVRLDANTTLSSTSVISDNTVVNAGVGDGVSPSYVGGNGIWLQAGNGVIVSGNSATGSVTSDCRDATTGTGTAGSGNTWTANVGATSSPTGLCSAPISPAITSGTPTTPTAGSTYTFPITATGTGPITYTITAGSLPAGLTLDPVTGIISGTPTAGRGSATVTITAASPYGSAAATYTLTTAAAASITTTAPPPASPTGGVPGIPAAAAVLANTGSPAGWLLLIAFALLGAGTMMLCFVRQSSPGRRRARPARSR